MIVNIETIDEINDSISNNRIKKYDKTLKQIDNLEILPFCI